MSALDRLIPVACFILALGSALSAQATTSANSAVRCHLSAGANALLFESSERGAERLTLSSDLYVLRYGNRLYLSRTEGSKTVVFDMTAFSELQSPRDIASMDHHALIFARESVGLAQHGQSRKSTVIEPATLEVQSCEHTAIAPERFSLASLPAYFAGTSQ